MAIPGMLYRPHFSNIALALASGLLLSAAWWGPWLAPLLFGAFLPLLFLQEKLQEEGQGEGLRVFRLAFLAFGLWNLLGTW